MEILAAAILFTTAAYLLRPMPVDTSFAGTFKIIERRANLDRRQADRSSSDRRSQK